MTPEIVADLRERLARVEEKQNGLGVDVRDGFAELGRKLDKFDDRVRGVEMKSGLYGTMAGGVVSVVIDLVMARLKSGA